MVLNVYKKVKAWCGDNRNDLFIASLIFFTGLSGFGLGRLSVDLKPNLPLSVTQPIDGQSRGVIPSNGVEGNNKKVVASRHGTTYYFPWCSGAKRIKEENKVWFTTKEIAQKAGLKPAGGCHGL